MDRGMPNGAQFRTAPAEPRGIPNGAKLRTAPNSEEREIPKGGTTNGEKSANCHSNGAKTERMLRMPNT